MARGEKDGLWKRPKTGQPEKKGRGRGKRKAGEERERRTRITRIMEGRWRRKGERKRVARRRKKLREKRDDTLQWEETAPPDGKRETRRTDARREKENTHKAADPPDNEDCGRGSDRAKDFDG